MLLVFKPCNLYGESSMALKIEQLLLDYPQASILKIRSNISDREVPFIHCTPKIEKNTVILTAGHGFSTVILANLFKFWDDGLIFKIKKDYFLLSDLGLNETQKTIENFFGKGIWEG